MHAKGSMTTAAAAALLVAASTAVPGRVAAAQLWGPKYFPNVPLQTQDGKTVHFYDDLLKDKIVAVDMIYTHCKFSCPLETARLASVQRLLGDRVGKDIFFISVTLDPQRDTPEVLKAYAEKFHAGPGWAFVTGKKEDIELVGQKLGLLSASGDPTPINRDGHTPELMIGNVATGTWMRNSALDNAHLLAATMRAFLDGPRSEAATTSYAKAAELHVSKGQYLFSTRCAACHTLGKGDSVGPDLLGVTTTRNRRWLGQFIQFPDRVLDSSDPTAKALYVKYRQVRMPNLSLGPEDVAALLDYLDAQSKARADGAGTAARAAVAGAVAASR